MVFVSIFMLVAACGGKTPREPTTARFVAITATAEIPPTLDEAVIATAAPLSHTPTQIPNGGAVDDSNQDCVARTLVESIRSAEELVDGQAYGSVPGTYALKVQVETTSLWTSVEVTGVDSITSQYNVIRGDGEINVDVEGLKVYDLSRPAGTADQFPKVVLEIDAIVQKKGDTAAFRIRKGSSGTTVYRLFESDGNSTKEIAQFTNDSTGSEDNPEMFLLDLNVLTSPLSFPTAEERYTGPMFDAHLHLVGSKDREHTEARFDRLHITPETAEEFFAMMDKENVIGMIGFLPVIHEFFEGDNSYNRSYLEKTSSVVNRCDNKIIPFLYPYSHIGIPPKEHGFKLPKLIDQIYNRGNPIPFRGIGEIHTGYPQTDSYADMRLVDPAMLELYDLAAANDLIVMIHPELDDIEDLHRALAHNPNTIFLLHGLVNSVERAPIAKELETLFREHSNVYYSVDAALMEGYSLGDDRIKDKEQFIANLRSKPMYYRILASALVFWKPIIEGYPTRMVWGTDPFYWWHFEPDVIHEVIRLGRDFIAGLEPEVQKNFAYRNAIELLGLPVE